ncbi:MAG: 50S ribosomal protein L24 [Acidimicrobiaceae bacterium]|nr:50S ribosomal protein L24 [Acidimicrobiaceae bacterium]
MRLIKGDKVSVLTGKDRGKQGEIASVIPKAGKVIVNGVNVVKKHQKARTATEQGGIIDKDMPIDASNVAIVCSKCGPTRIGMKFEADGKKIRVCKKCGGDL